MAACSYIAARPLAARGRLRQALRAAPASPRGTAGRGDVRLSVITTAGYRSHSACSGGSADTSASSTEKSSEELVVKGEKGVRVDMEMHDLLVGLTFGGGGMGAGRPLYIYLDKAARAGPIHMYRYVELLIQDIYI